VIAEIIRKLFSFLCIFTCDRIINTLSDHGNGKVDLSFVLHFFVGNDTELSFAF